MVLLVFFDVVFLKGTLQPSNINPQIIQPADWHTKTLFSPLNPNTAAYFGYGDLGATAWQSEPARYLVARDLNAGESLYWNPYSAAGTVGPEVLADLKFSPFTLISAYFFDASPESFDFGLIIIYVIGSYFILLTLTRYFHLGLLAAAGGAIVFLLNGFALPNLNSQNGQPYFFSPLLLYTLIAFSEKQTCWRWICISIAHAILLLITLPPTLLLTLFAVHSINLAYYFQTRSNTGSASHLKTFEYLSYIFISVMMAFLLTAALWAPIFNSFLITDIMTDYSARQIQPSRSLDSLLSIFTPKHFWENYSGTIPARIYPQVILEMDAGIIAHTGIFGAVIASYALAYKNTGFNFVVKICAALLVLSYTRVFGFADFMNYLPIVRSIGIQYWGCVSAIAFLILVAFGIENITAEKKSPVPAIIILTILAAFFVKLLLKIGFTEIFPYSQYLKIIIFLFILSIFSIRLIHQSGEESKNLVYVITAIMLIEFLFYMNHVRPARYDAISKKPEFIDFIKEKIHDGRVLNIGLSRTLYPEYGAMYGIRQADTQNPGRLPWYRDFYQRHFGSDTAFFLTLGHYPEKNQVVLKERVLSEMALDIAGIKYLLVVDNAMTYRQFLIDKKYPVVFQKDNLTIFENPDYLTTAILVPALVQASQIPETSDFNPRITAISDDVKLISQAQQLGIPVLLSTDRTSIPAQGTTSILSYHNTEIIMAVESTQPVILALSEVWHPHWQATIDGQAVYVGRINEAFRGIALPSGKHRVRMYYDSAALHYGIYVSAVSVILLVLLAVISLKFPSLFQLRKRKHAP